MLPAGSASFYQTIVNLFKGLIKSEFEKAISSHLQSTVRVSHGSPASGDVARAVTEALVVAVQGRAAGMGIGEIFIPITAACACLAYHSPAQINDLASQLLATIPTVFALDPKMDFDVSLIKESAVHGLHVSGPRVSLIRIFDGRGRMYTASLRLTIRAHLLLAFASFPSPPLPALCSI